jgi:hypothetical protein
VRFRDYGKNENLYNLLQREQQGVLEVKEKIETLLLIFFQTILTAPNLCPHILYSTFNGPAV